MRPSLIIAVIGLACVNCTYAADKTSLETEDDKALYAMGLALARQIASFELSEKEFASVNAGFADGALNRDPQLDLAEYGPKIQGFVQARNATMAEREKGESAEFIEQMSKNDGAVREDSGLIYIETVAGTGARPAATDTVKVHYHGTLRDGTVFDSSVDRGTPATFALNRVIPCWTEGVQKMSEGGKATLVCPSAIAYGERGSPPTIKPGAALAFDVELISIESTGSTE